MKFRNTWFFVIAVLAMVSPLATADLDTNFNGASDVWERAFNNGELFASYDPSADYDGDGWINEKEEIFGTDPFKPSPQDGMVEIAITQHPTLPSTFALRWTPVRGKISSLYVSPDLVGWTLFDTFPSSGDEIQIAIDASHEDDTAPDKLFWRAVISDADAMGNGLTDYETAALGMSPGFTDGNSNQIPDAFESANAGAFAVFPPVLASKMPRLQAETKPLFLWNDTDAAVNYTVAVNGAGVAIYSHSDSLTGGVIYAWEDISLTGTRLASVSNADDASEPALLTGFSFPFYGQNYNQVFVSSNGLLSFGAGTAAFLNRALPDSSAPPSIIAALWDDLDTRTSGDIYFKEESDRFIVQFENVTRRGSTDTLTFQVVLFSDGRIVLRYKTLNGTTSSCTVGIQNQTRDEGITVLYNSAYLANGMTVEIRPVFEFLEISPLVGNVPAHSSLSLDAVFDSFKLTPAIYYAEVEVSHDAAAPAPLQITARLEVENVRGTVALTSPSEGLSILEGNSVSFQAVANDPEGVARVEFYHGSVKFAEDLTSPYSVSRTDIPPGTQSITARMMDVFGQTVVSAPRTLHVIADSDFDKIPNDWELAHGLDPNDPSDASADPDRDGYSNLEEYTRGEDPNGANLTDTDGDGIIDGIERKLIYRTSSGGWGYFNLNSPDTDQNGILDGAEDYDFDGLTTLQEILAGTDANKSDTDLDGVNDGIELLLGTNPLVHDAWFDAQGIPRDSDGDGLSDVFEIMIGTDPFNADTNGNGMNDGDELDAGGSPGAAGPAPPPSSPPVTGSERPADGSPQPPALLSSHAGYEILVESKTVSFPKYGFETFQTLDPAKRYLKKSSSQSFRGGCPESGPLGVTGQRSTTVNELTGEETTEGDTFVNTGGDVQSPVRKAGSNNLSSYDDPPNSKNDCTGKVNYFTLLSEENTTPRMVTNGKSKLDPFEGGEALQPGNPFAYRNVHENELRFDYQKTQFKFKWDASIAEEDRHALTYLVVFTPEDDPDTTEDESDAKEIVQTIEWDGQSAESPLYTVDPDMEKSDEDGQYFLLPVEIEIRKKGETTSDESVLVKTGDILEFALAEQHFDQENQFEELITWQFRQMKANGSYEQWADFGAHGKGSKFEHTTALGGIFQVKAIIDGGSEFFYDRDSTEEIEEEFFTTTIGPGIIGEPDSVGVCDDQEQIDLCRKAQELFGSRKYDPLVAVEAEYGFPEHPASPSALRCNIFVAHVGVSAGLNIPKINGYFNEYPPLANEWAGIEWTGVHPTPGEFFAFSLIPNWPILLGEDKPQPGWIIAHPSPGDAGHVGIIDYDGGGIGAGISGTVNKNFEEFFDGTSKYRKYEE